MALGKPPLPLTSLLKPNAPGRKAALAVVDTDPQGSLAAWWNSREAQTPLFASVDIARLPDHLRILQRRQVALVVIDTPPALTDTIRAAIAVADLVVIPARPSPDDLRAVGVIVEMAEAASMGGLE